MVLTYSIEYDRLKIYAINPKAITKTQKQKQKERVIAIKPAKEIQMESQIIINLEESKKGEKSKQKTDGVSRKQIER